MKRSKDYLAEANALVPRISAQEAIERYAVGDSIIIDVRDTADINKSGTVRGAHRVERGFIEFAADDETSLHKPFFKKDANILLICGAGGMAALAGKTLKEMGYERVTNIGGFKDWKAAGGPVED